jgi:hypothetical protein
MAEKKDTEPQAQESQAEGVTTRDDANDLGVPMLAGSSDEPTGPEDALGEGPKRGDYTDRIGPSNYHPHEAKVVEGQTRLEAQRPRASEVGEVAGRKGGVDSAEG